MRGMEKQAGAVDDVESSRREGVIRSFWEWYQTYAEWLGNNVVNFEEDLTSAYADGSAASVRAERYESLADGYEKLGAQLEERVSHLEKLNAKTEERIRRLRRALEYVASAGFLEERSRDKRQSQPGVDRRGHELYDQYKDITDLEIAMMQLELRNLEERQKQHLVLIETGHMELNWISRKTGDYDALSHLVKPLAWDRAIPPAEAFNQVIRIYESDIAYFKKKTDDLTRARTSLVASGTLRTLDRVEELSETYTQMKKRYEQHMAWLSEQVGAYRADLTQFRKDK
jgi:hypothetical protein